MISRTPARILAHILAAPLRPATSQTSLFAFLPPSSAFVHLARPICLPFDPFNRAISAWEIVMARCHERTSRASKSKLAVWQSGDAVVAILTSRPVASNFGSNLRAGINEGDGQSSFQVQPLNDLIERHGTFLHIAYILGEDISFPRTTGLQVSRTRSRGPGLTRLDQEMEDRY